MKTESEQLWYTWSTRGFGGAGFQIRAASPGFLEGNNSVAPESERIQALLAHARYAAATGDVGVPVPKPRSAAPLETLRSVTAVHAKLASSPRAALRNLAYLHNDLADPALHRHLLRMSRAARVHYEKLVADAVAAGELRADTNVQALARSIEVTLNGSFLGWTLYREGSAAEWLREDLEATLRPYLMRPKNA